MSELVDLHIDLATFDDEKSISMTEAAQMIRGRGGRGNAAMEVVRRWANPKYGCKPQGSSGPVLILPAVKVANALRTMPEWVERFQRAREQMGQPRSMPSTRTPRQRAAAIKRAEARLDKAGIGVKRKE